MTVIPGGAEFDVGKMALYNLDRARNTMDKLSGKPKWDLQDTASFDCMHYLGNSAIENAARQLSLKPGERVIDIGAGFNATGRYLHQHYGADVTGIELQKEIHDLAQTITEKNRSSAGVHSVNGDFLQLDLGAPADHIVSFLCILHIPDRSALFTKAARTLKPGGKLYVEDFFALQPLGEQEKTQLRDIVSCPYLPSREEYIRDLQAAGFGDVQFVDMTKQWSAFLHERATEYKQDTQFEKSLGIFYDTVDSLFSGGQVGGVRITCQKV